MRLSRKPFVILFAACLAASLLLIALAVTPVAAKGPPPVITVCGANRCVDIQERSIQRAPLTWALLSGGHSGARAGCRAEAHRVRVRWRGHGASGTRRFLIVANRGLRSTGRIRGSGHAQSWIQVHGERRKAMKRAARRAGPGTPLCQLTARRALLQDPLRRAAADLVGRPS